ncbi:hypothetical protein XELAEV_18019342mg [Xenopus laevis]|uniref:Uncharacterized protein n=1 Tax=Xenopus laevis TaxID=8355 RepID=A0A974HUH8_XENLA|nr:hypothetical protein XELAEV_18019342mg [Xenopus laevis]
MPWSFFRRIGALRSSRASWELPGLCQTEGHDQPTAARPGESPAGTAAVFPEAAGGDRPEQEAPGGGANGSVAPGITPAEGARLPESPPELGGGVSEGSGSSL